jgi:hypothetical protein
MRIDFYYFEDCPSHEPALQRLRQVMEEEGVEAEVRVARVDSEERARELRFVGSPTIRVDGEDVTPPPEGAPYRLTCRVFELEDGRVSPLPSAERIRKALRAAR